MEVLELPQEVVERADKLRKVKEQKKAEIGNLKGR